MGGSRGTRRPETGSHQQHDGADRDAVGAGGARDLPQRRERLLRAAGQGARAARPGGGGRPRRGHQRRRVHQRHRLVDQRPRARPAVQGGHRRHHPADHAGGDREVSGLGHDPRHRPGLRQGPGGGVRRGGVRPDRAGAGAAARGDRHRRQAGQPHRRRLGRPEGHPRDHAVPARQRRRHLAGGADLQDLRAGGDRADHREPLPPGPRHPRHRLPHRRPGRGQAGHRQGGDDPGARRVCPSGWRRPPARATAACRWPS